MARPSFRRVDGVTYERAIRCYEQVALVGVLARPSFRRVDGVTYERAIRCYEQVALVGVLARPIYPKSRAYKDNKNDKKVSGNND